MEIMEPKEAWIRLHTQEVRGSSPCAPTILFKHLQRFDLAGADFWYTDRLLFLWISLSVPKSGPLPLS